MLTSLPKQLFRRSTEAFIFIILVALILRIDVYSVGPYIDEEAYDWLAFNLSQGRLRTGSSYASVYAQFGAVVPDGVDPWLDHPVLYPLILGIFKAFFRFVFKTDLTFYGSRLVSVLIFSLPTIYFSMLVCKRMFGTASALITGLLFALTPSVSLMQQMILLDQGVALFSILSVFALIKHLDDEGSKWLILSAIFAGSASLCKGTGVFAVVAVPLTIIFWRGPSLSKKVIRSSLALLIGALLFLIYPLYGYLLNSSLLQAISSTQLASHPIRVEWLIRSMVEYPWSFQHVYDLFLLFGWIATAYLFIKGLEDNKVEIPVIWLVCYGAILVFVARNAYYYSQIVLYPFLSIAIGKMLFDIVSFIRKTRIEQSDT